MALTFGVALCDFSHRGIPDFLERGPGMRRLVLGCPTEVGLNNPSQFEGRTEVSLRPRRNRSRLHPNIFQVLLGLESPEMSVSLTWPTIGKP
jgi:hypothetical protein